MVVILPKHSEMNLVKSKSVVFCAILKLLVLAAPPTSSIIIPPRLFIPFYQHEHNFATEHPKLDDNDQVPYVLSINEGSSESVSVNSRSFITINLNRAIPHVIEVVLSVYSGPKLITFDPAQQQSDVSPTDDQYSNLSRQSSPTSIEFNYTKNTFGDHIVSFETNNLAGHAEIIAKIKNQPDDIKIDCSSAFISVDIYRNWNLNIVIQIVGWIYFFAWSISFYFQFILNCQRKSVVGLNFDFLALNLLGFACYSIYNSALLFSYETQQQYYKKYAYSRVPVEYNDLFFALHASVITIATIIQCFIYERGEQKVSISATLFLCVSSTLGAALFVASLFNAVTILDVVLYLSYVKLIISCIKYVPQAYMNYKRKATTGWSIHNIILDFTGGSFSLFQMILIAYNYNDWISIFGNFTKFGLGLISMVFDVIFLTQHYVIYRNVQPVLSNNDLENSSESVPSPVISQSIRSANLTQQQNADESDDTTE